MGTRKQRSAAESARGRDWWDARPAARGGALKKLDEFCSEACRDAEERSQLGDSVEGALSERGWDASEFPGDSGGAVAALRRCREEWGEVWEVQSALEKAQQGEWKQGGACSVNGEGA